MPKEVPTAITSMLSIEDDCCGEVAEVDLAPSSSTRRDVLMLPGTTPGCGDDQLQRDRGDRGADGRRAGVVVGADRLRLDSVIEVSSAAAVAWQFAGRDPQAREKVALRVIACSFFALALFVTIDAGRSLFGVGAAAPSRWVWFWPRSVSR